MSDTVFIYSISRSGGSSLHSSISKLVQPDSVLIEPFSWTGELSVPREEEDNYGEYIERFFRVLEMNNTTTVRHTIDHLSHLDEHDSADHKILSNFDKVVLNSRSNRLRHIISHLIAEKTGAWKDFHVDSEYYENSIVLDLDEIERRILEYREKWRDRVTFLEEEGISYVDVNYENFYKELDLHSRVENLIQICKNFYNLSVSDRKIRGVLSELSNQRNQNNRRTYSIVQNIDKINNELGPKYGFLY